MSAERVSAELLRLLEPSVHAETVARLGKVREALGEPGGAARAAAVAAGMLGLDG
jgi:hypothetical protein